MANRKFKKQRGFTIIEVIVTAFVFSIIVIEIGSVFVQLLSVERRGFSSQKIQENAMFVLETMAREIRVSRIINQDDDPDHPCTKIILQMEHPVNGNITYTINNGVVKRTIGGTPSVTTSISSSDVNFTRLNFCVDGSGSNDGKQTRVAILASIQNRTGKDIIQFDLETTVTSRDVSSEEFIKIF